MYSASYDSGTAATKIPQNYNGSYDFEHLMKDISSAENEKEDARESFERAECADVADAEHEDCAKPPCDNGRNSLTDLFSCEDLLLLGLAAYMFFAEEESVLALVLIILLLIR